MKKAAFFLAAVAIVVQMVAGLDVADSAQSVVEHSSKRHQQIEALLNQ